jgi:hypothetical protein
LWGFATKTALVVIPEEAELIIPVIRVAKSSPVQLIAYAAPTTKNMIHFCKLDYYVLPRLPDGHALPDWLGIELGMLGARLYFTFAEYGLLKKYLHPTMVPGAHDEIAMSKQGAMSTISFNAFLYDWLTIRRKGQDITMTPMGYLCRGKPLHESHPFFKVAAGDGGRVLAVSERKIPAPANGMESSESDGEVD